MSSQFIIPPAIGLMLEQTKKLKTSYVFNATMASHYEDLYKKNCKGWRFTKAAFYYLTWKRFAKTAAEIELKLQLTPSHKN